MGMFPISLILVRSASRIADLRLNIYSTLPGASPHSTHSNNHHNDICSPSARGHGAGEDLRMNATCLIGGGSCAVEEGFTHNKIFVP